MKMLIMKPTLTLFTALLLAPLAALHASELASIWFLPHFRGLRGEQSDWGKSEFGHFPRGSAVVQHMIAIRTRLKDCPTVITPSPLL
jgi:hypothetical protein